MKRVIQSVLLIMILSLFISIVIGFLESKSNEVISFLEGGLIAFLSIFYASISSVLYVLLFDVKFYGHIADYTSFFYSYKGLIIFSGQVIIDFLLLYIFYYFNKTKKIYIYAIFILIFKIVLAYTIGGILI